MVHSQTRIGNETAPILRQSLLWYAFTPEGQVDIPTTLCERIHNAYEVLNNNLPPGTNPVKRFQLLSQEMKQRSTLMKYLKA